MLGASWLPRLALQQVLFLPESLQLAFPLQLVPWLVQLQSPPVPLPCMVLKYLGVLVWQKSLLEIVTYGSPVQLFISDSSLEKTIDL